MQSRVHLPPKVDYLPITACPRVFYRSQVIREVRDPGMCWDVESSAAMFLCRREVQEVRMCERGTEIC